MQEIMNEMAPTLQMRLGYAYVLPQVFENL